MTSLYSIFLQLILTLERFRQKYSAEFSLRRKPFQAFTFLGLGFKPRRIQQVLYSIFLQLILTLERFRQKYSAEFSLRRKPFQAFTFLGLGFKPRRIQQVLYKIASQKIIEKISWFSIKYQLSCLELFYLGEATLRSLRSLRGSLRSPSYNIVSQN